MEVDYDDDGTDDDDDNPDPAARLRGCPSCEASMLPTQSDEALTSHNNLHLGHII